MEIWLKQDETQYRFAVLPPEYEITSESDNTQVSIHAFGEINLLGKRKLKTISLSSFFPYQTYACCQYTTFPTPEESIKLIEEMKENGVLRLIMTGTAAINMECTIENFTWGEKDATKDIPFTLELKEYRRVKLVLQEEKEMASSNIEPAATQRAAKEVKSTTYTVKKGDSLCAIARKITGSSTNWKAIYEQNKEVIGSNPNRIYPGQELMIHVEG